MRSLPSDLREVPLDDVEELEGEVVHHRVEHLHSARKLVVEDDGRDGGKEAHGGGDQRLRDASIFLATVYPPF